MCSLRSEKSFLGITIPNLIAICGLLLSILFASLSANSRVTTLETKQVQIEKEQTECKAKIERTQNDVSEIKGDIKAIKEGISFIKEAVRK